MIISNDYKDLMRSEKLPERFRAGDYFVDEEEVKTLKEFVKNFYEAVEENQGVTLEDFTEFMDFMDVIRDAENEEVQDVVTEAFVRSAKIRNKITKE